MKLGNQGFGMKEMIIYTCLLILLLIFVSIEIDSFYKNLSSSKANNETQEIEPSNEDEEEINSTPDTYVDYNYYYSLETRLKVATQNYIDAYPYSLETDILTITSNDLESLGYLTPMYAQDNKSICQGYSNVYKQEDEIVIYPFITCYNYQTTTNN